MDIQVTFVEDEPIVVNFITDDPIIVEFKIENQIPDLVGQTPITNETPQGLVNGSNALFTTLFAFKAESFQVRVNGITQQLITDYTILSNNTFQFSESPQTGDIIQVDYLKF